MEFYLGACICMFALGEARLLFVCVFFARQIEEHCKGDRVGKRNGIEALSRAMYHMYVKDTTGSPVYNTERFGQYPCRLVGPLSISL